MKVEKINNDNKTIDLLAKNNIGNGRTIIFNNAFSIKSLILDVKRCILDVSKISAALSLTHCILPSFAQQNVASGNDFSTSNSVVLNKNFNNNKKCASKV